MGDVDIYNNIVKIIAVYIIIVYSKTRKYKRGVESMFKKKKESSNGVKKKDTFNISHIKGYLIVLVGILLVSFLACCGIEFVMKWIKENVTLVTFEPKGLLSLQATISFLSISIMNIILPEKENRILGLTYQNIFFNSTVLRYFNAADCIMYLILMLISNISLAVISTLCIDSYIKNISNLCFIIILFVSVILAFYMLHLSMISKFKKSRIYYLIYKKLDKDGKELYHEIVKGLIWHSEETKKINYDYYIDEIKILMLMKDKTNELFDSQEVNKNLSSRLKRLDEGKQEDIIELKQSDIEKILVDEIDKRKRDVRKKVNDVKGEIDKIVNRDKKQEIQTNQ